MPELPEVETIAAALRRGILHKRIKRVDVRNPLIIKGPPANFSSALKGSSVTRIFRHGKTIRMDLQADKTNALHYLYVHLGMTGQLLFVPSAAPYQSHTHMVFEFDGVDRQLRHRDPRRFGYMECLETPKVMKLGPDAWDSSPDELFKRLRGCSGFLKNALLNQQVIAGLGNIYVDESLFQTKLHPRRRLESLSVAKCRELCAHIRAVLKRSLEVGGTSFRNYVDTEGSRGGFREGLHVYGKQGAPCSRCSTIIRKIVVAGRGTHFCPQCQPAPRTVK